MQNKANKILKLNTHAKHILTLLTQLNHTFIQVNHTLIMFLMFYYLLLCFCLLYTSDAADDLLAV